MLSITRSAVQCRVHMGSEDSENCTIDLTSALCRVQSAECKVQSAEQSVLSMSGMRGKCALTSQMAGLLCLLVWCNGVCMVYHSLN